MTSERAVPDESEPRFGDQPGTPIGPEAGPNSGRALDDGAAPAPGRCVTLAVVFIAASVALLTVAAGGIDGIGHAAAHLLPNLIPGGCGGG